MSDTPYIPRTYPVSVKGVVIRDNRVLLLRNERNEWELPGGKIEIGETPEGCLAREVEEETGWPVRVVEILDSWIYHITQVDRHVFIVTYGCRVDSHAPVVVSSETQGGRAIHRSPGPRPADAGRLQAVGPGLVLPIPGLNTAPAVRWLWLLPEARQVLEARELAVILRCYRKLTGLSQSAMGELLGYNPSYVSLLERRQRTINDRQGLSPASRALAIHRTPWKSRPRRTPTSSPRSSSGSRPSDSQQSHGRPDALLRQSRSCGHWWPAGGPSEGGAGRLRQARARATLSTSLGHALAEERLYLAASWTGRATRLARHLDDGAFLGHVLRMHGNELRKAGRGGAAIARLTEAAELSRNGQERGQTLILLARAAGEQGNAVLLDDSVTAAERLMDTAGPSGILFAPFSLREVHMRA